MPIARSAERLGRRLSSALALTAALVLPALSAGCVSNAKGPITNALGITPSPIEDKEFAAHLHTVLRGQKPGDAASALRLGVVKQQLSHASGRFDRGSDDRGLHSVLGAFYLLRQGDRGDPLIDATTSRAFDGAIRRVSARGDLGKARYLLGLIATARKAGKVPGSAAESEAHVADLDRWVSDTRKGSPIEKAGEAERAAVSRVLLDPSKNASNDATQAISGWIDLAIEINIAFRQTGRRPTQEEAIESTRALESGAPTLVAMGLRLGDLDATVASVEGSSARRIVDPDFYRVLKSSSQANTGQSWRAVFAELDRQTSDKIGGEIGVDEELLDAAFFNAALEAYRREPTDLPICVELSRSLVSYGMSEAVPLVMADGLGGAQPSSENLGAAISLVRAALDADASSGDYAATARTIAASGTFLEVAGKAAAKTAALAPLRYDMASIQIHAGDLEAAKASLEAATQEAPSSAGLKLLAMVERQLGDTKGALALAARSSEVRGADPLDAADAQLLIYEIERSAGQKDEAAASLERALKSTLKARTRNGAAPYRVRAERMLGSILLAYGENAAAGRAYDRALDQVSGDRGLIGTTLLKAMGFCLLTGDVERARSTLKKGREAGANEEDLVYGALWLMLLEKQTHAKSDGRTDQTFEATQASTAWVGRLSGWALGKTSDAALLASAQTASNKVEANFYVAMKKRAGGTPDDAALKAISLAPVLDLLEVDLARELSLPALRVALPKGVTVP